ncbi:MAG: inositol monophosphatase family protein, partial [Sphingomonas sp.]
MRVTDAEIAFAETLAGLAGEAIRPYFRNSHGLEAKDDSSPVTLADRAAEAAMRAAIEARFPDDAIIGEEYGVREGTSGRAW